MQVHFAYRRRSTILAQPAGLAIALSPNLRRDRVSFNGTLKQPLHFREAISALHDVVISDLTYKPKDDSAYQAYKKQEQERENAIRRVAHQQTRKEIESQRAVPIPPGLEAEYRRWRKVYWDARQAYSNYIARHDPELWRLLMPCDPVVTVAPDVLLFECFSADESSYGCLSVNRDAFNTEQDVALGTTNVDYSWSLYEHFQQLRSYRETRFLLDPTGFEVQTQESAEHREEKIPLPPGWLRGFMQLQSAMVLPTRRVRLPREALYSLLAWLKRHKAKRSPRALRFELTPGKPIVIAIEPWNQLVTVAGSSYDGPKAETIRTWGRDRLRVLARLLPLIESIDVHLLGSGYPSFWVANMGPMRLTLGLSGWTTNDWTGGSALDQLMPPVDIDFSLLERIGGAFRENTALTFEDVCKRTFIPPPQAAAGLNRLALLGQVIHDLSANVYRWRQVMPERLTLEELGSENPETEAAKRFVAQGQAVLVRDETTPSGLRLLTGRVQSYEPEILVDGDGRIVRGKCKCSHHFKSGLRKGPCRHLQALRNAALGVGAQAVSLDKWFAMYWK
jgi:hypothetical protein